MTIGILLSGCGSNSRVAAVVNGEVISVSELDGRMARINPATQASFGGDKKRFLEELIMERILFQEARRRGLEKDGEFRRFLEEAKRQLLVGRLVEALRGEAVAQVPEEQVAEFYQKNRESFRMPESYRASHILVDGEETAKKALQRIQEGEPFAKVAEELSTDPSKSRGGDIGFFSSGQVIPEFEAACRNLKPGEMSRPIKTPLGYHVILLTEMRASRQRLLEEVQDQIRQALLKQQSQRHVESSVQRLREQAQVKIRKDLSPQPEAPAAPAAEPTAQNPQS